MPVDELLSILGAFVVRLGVPLAVTILVTWALHCLDARWRRQAAAQQALCLGVQPPRLQPSAAPASQPCWEVKQCPPARRAACSAYQQPQIACWLTHLRRDGRLPAGCRTCPLFSRASTALPQGAD